MRYEFDGVRFDVGARQLRRGQTPIHLSPKAMELLILLIASRPRAVPKRELYDGLWPDTFVVEKNLTILIREIRGALDDKQRRMIRTVHRTGYAFAVPVREVTSPRRERIATEFAHFLLYNNHEYRLGDGENFVGREPGAEIFLPSASVSRRHAVIVIDGRRAALTDLASKNGTFIGDEPLQQQTSLEDGNIIRFGEVIVRYRFLSADGTTDSLNSG